jgi:hypothetical protein
MLETLSHSRPTARKPEAIGHHATIVLALWASALSLAFGSGCSKASHAATTLAADDMSASSVHGDCGHSACGSNFFVDVAAPASCAVGAPCGLSLRLVATGDFHINEEYPYKFKAEDVKGVEFLGTDDSGKNVFSKGANNWQRKDEKTGTMAVSFRAAEKGDKPISGTFKLSVCSPQSCQLEQQPVTTTVSFR